MMQPLEFCSKNDISCEHCVGNEAALFMRLHLLQAVVLFHQNKRQEASKLLARADSELSSLKVDDYSLSTLMELGV